MSKTIIGIDPGKNGGIAWFYENGEAFAVKMPATERDLWDVINVMDGEVGSVAYVEKVTAIHPGVKNICSMLKLQANYWQIRAFVVAAYIRLESPTPGKWQKEFGLVRTKEETIAAKKNMSKANTAKKNRHKAKAQELFPQLKITHAIADALLIAEYGRRMEARDA
jgi:hypothetical protein